MYSLNKCVYLYFRIPNLNWKPTIAFTHCLILIPYLHKWIVYKYLEPEPANRISSVALRVILNERNGVNGTRQLGATEATAVVELPPAQEILQV